MNFENGIDSIQLSESQHQKRIFFFVFILILELLDESIGL